MLANLAEFIEVILPSITTLGVAILVAIIATRRETGKQLAQRHFEFRDERADIYANLILKMNAAIGVIFECWGATHVLSKPEIRKANETALEMETATLRAQIHVPDFVAHACLDVNGRIQTLISQLENEDGISMSELDFEKSKRNMLKAMKVDIRSIEKTPNRTAYTKTTDAENVRYFGELNMPVPP